MKKTLNLEVKKNMLISFDVIGMGIKVTLRGTFLFKTF